MGIDLSFWPERKVKVVHKRPRAKITTTAGIAVLGTSDSSLKRRLNWTVTLR